jgi:alpha-glucosidase
LSSRDARHRNWYVWADPKPNGSPPNNWASGFSDSAWSLHEPTGQYVLHNFSPRQPDLNWWNDEVRQAFDEIQQFWYDRGVAGFRLDVAHMLIKDDQLRDNPPATEEAGFVERLLGQRMVYNSNRPETHEILQGWRKLADSYNPSRTLIGETVVHDLRDLAQFYGTGVDELHLALNVPFQESAFDAGALRDVVTSTEDLLPPAAWPLWSGSNHDISRMTTRWAGGDPRRIRLALLLLLTLRGTPLLYQGDEIGLPDGPISEADLRDPVGLRLWPAHPGRDPERTPMQWSAQPGGGFTTSERPWLPLGDAAACNVADQRDDPASPLRLTRDLVALRRQREDLATGSYEAVPSPDDVWMWRRGHATLVIANFSDTTQRLPVPTGRVAIHTLRHRDGEDVSQQLEIGPWEGLIVMTA